MASSQVPRTRHPSNQGSLIFLPFKTTSRELPRDNKEDNPTDCAGESNKLPSVQKLEGIHPGHNDEPGNYDQSVVPPLVKLQEPFKLGIEKNVQDEKRQDEQTRGKKEAGPFKLTKPLTIGIICTSDHIQPS